MNNALPPRLAERLLGKAISDSQARQAVLGDLHEQFADLSRRLGPAIARSWYWLAAGVAVLWYSRERALNAMSSQKRKGAGRMEHLTTDVRQAWRAMRRRPLFTLTAALTLALGIGANSAVFSVVHGVLIKPLPYPNPQELVSVAHTAPGLGFRSIGQTESTYYTYRQDSRAFENLGIWRPAVVSVTGLAEPHRARILFVTEGILPALKVRPALGRLFDSGDTSTDSPLTVILTYGYWQGRFGGDAEVVGQTMRIESIDWLIVGVLPEDFRFLSEEAQFLLPIRLDPPSGPATPSFDYQGLARLREGVSLQEANRDVARIIPQIWPYFRGMTAEKFREWRMGPDVRPLKNAVVGDVGGVLWLLLGTVGLVLLIACANVANLFLVRAESRRREVSVRTALGASRMRIIRQHLTESGMLGLMGGLAGLGLAEAGIRLLPSIAPQNLPRLEEISLSASVLLFTLAVSLLAGFVFGIFPVVHHANPHLASSLKDGGHGSSLGKRRQRLRLLLAVSQVSLALVLLIGAGLMLRSFQSLINVHPGFERPEEILGFRLGLPRAEASGPQEVVQTHLQILDRLAQLPGVSSVGATSSLPMDGWGNNNVIYAEGFPVAPGQTLPRRIYKAVGGDYFATLGIPLLAGRFIERADLENRRPVGVVTENIAREFWGEPSLALGKRIRHHPDDPWREIVGVVGNVRDRGLSQDPPSIVYWPLVVENFLGGEVWARRTMAYALRIQGSPTALLPQVRQAVWSVNPNLPLAGVRTLDAVVADSMARTTFILIMLGISTALAVLLGSVGIYAVISCLVAQRLREIGIRMALGARRRDVSRLVLSQGALVAAAGIVLGLAAAAGLTRFLAGLLFQISAADPSTYAAAAVAVALVALLASYLPARRAARVDPILVLKCE